MVLGFKEMVNDTVDTRPHINQTDKTEANFKKSDQ